MSSRFKLTTLALLLALWGAMPANAYYYFIHYLSSGNAPEKFDLAALPNNTVTFLVSESGPTVYGPTDTFNSVLAQIQQAVQVWNGVGSSSLRVAFGGLENSSTAQNTAGGDVLFEDLPPGVEGFGGPTSLASPVTAADGTQFFPIVRSVVHLSLNLTTAPGPSFGQSFLMTTLHEIGHSLGLQHTFTSATMSQNTTRATTLMHALSADDIAGISGLYPNANFQQFGTITGRVTAGGKGVHLASVVAIAPGADAVSAVTNPDGTFRISGVPPGQYSVYAHTMPPDANIMGPWNADGSVAAASGPVNSLFYPATTDYTQAGQLPIVGGLTTSGVIITTSSRTDVPYYDGQVYGYLNNNSIAVTPGPVAITSNTTPVVASIVGLGANGLAPGLGVQIPGGAVSIVPNGIVPYLANGYTYIGLYLALNAAAQPGPEHVIFNTPNYMYVLPSAMYLTLAPPPAVTGATANADGTVTVTGTNMVNGSLVYFDSLPATIRSLDPVGQVAMVIPPPGAPGQQATVTIYNPDGQNSLFVQASSPVTYPYGNLAPPAISAIAPASLPAGAEAMIDITGTGFSFGSGPVTIGFGTSDVLVQQVFILSPNHVQVNVLVSGKAALSATDVSVMSGFGTALAPGAFQITAPVANLPSPAPYLVNAYAAYGVTGAYPGAVVSIYGTNLVSQAAVKPTITLGGSPVTNILYWSANQVDMQIPAGLSNGLALLTVNNGLLNSLPVEVNIDPPPAGFSAVQTSSGAYIDSSQPAHQGDTLIATMNNFAVSGSAIATSRVQVSLGGVMYPALQITQIGSIWQITFQVGTNAPVGTAELLIVYLDGRSSLPATIAVSQPDGTFK